MAEILDWSKKSYLLIDDFSIVHRMLREMLRKFGATSIDTAKNGAEAIALLTRRQYDVVLCDYNFSEGPNGQQILEEARHRDLIALTTIWIMVSSEKAVETVMGAAEQAPDGYILKPLTESTLLSRLNRAADRKQAFSEIDKAYAARDFRKAIDLCDQRLAANRLHAADLLRMKAGLLVKCGDIQDARAVYEQAMSIRDQVWAKTGLAKLHYVTGQYSPAKFLLYEVISTNPSYLDAYDYLAQTLQKLGDNEEALQVLENAALLSPYSVIRQNNLGDLALKLDHLQLAERAFRMSIEVGEHSVFRSASPYLGLAKIYAKKKQLGEALHMIESARSSFEGDDVKIRSKLVEAQIYSMFKQAEKAHEIAAQLQRDIAPLRLQLGEEMTSEMNQLFAAAGLGAEAAQKAAATQSASEPYKTSAAATNISSPEKIEAPTLVTIHTQQKPVSTPMQAAAKDNVIPLVKASVQPVSAPPAKAADAAAASPQAPQAPNALMPSSLPTAPSDFPDKARTLVNRAHVLLQFMQRQGYNAVSAEETRSVIARMEKLVPGHAIIKDLHAALDTLLP
ncbi:MAG: response regulator [Burkholderiales bacterium]|nr:response regulator [Burkholderiales bacterium]